MSTTVKSITNEPITSDTLFIVLSTKISDPVLTIKYHDNNISIFTISNYDLLYSSLNIPTNFVMVSDVCVNNTSTSFDILLVNNSFSELSHIPITYEKIIKIDSGYIWRPCKSTFPDIFVPIGYIYSVDMPSNYGRIININYTKIYSNQSPDLLFNNLVFSNEFNMFVLPYDDKLTVNIDAIMSIPHITHDGKLIKNNKCVTTVDGYNSDIDCSMANVNEWKNINGSIVNNKTNKVFTSSDNSVDVSNVWKNKIGNNVILTQSNTPWFDDPNIDEDSQIKKNRDYISDHAIFNFDNIKKIMKTQPINGIEPFTSDNNKSFNFFILILIIIIVVLFIVLKRYN